MQDIVQDALSQEERDAVSGAEPSPSDGQPPRQTGDDEFLFIGCGGAGSAVIDTVTGRGAGSRTIALDTDDAQLEATRADETMVVDGGGDEKPVLAEDLSPDQVTTLGSVLDAADCCFILAGLAGTTGVELAAQVRSMARGGDSLSVGLGLLPLGHESIAPERLMSAFDTLAGPNEPCILVDNRKLATEHQSTEPLSGADFRKINESVAWLLQQMTESVTQPGLQNLKLADLERVLRTEGAAVVRSIPDATNSSQEPEETPPFDLPVDAAPSEIPREVVFHLTVGPETDIGTVEAVGTRLYEALDGDHTPEPSVRPALRIQEFHDEPPEGYALAGGYTLESVLGTEYPVDEP